MQDFFLVIDTETSGLPKNWSAPYSKENNWPYIVQIAWIIYDQNFEEIKRENHFIKNTDFTIDESALKIHNITAEYLQTHGEDKKEVMLLLYNDILTYKPLIIGHFIELDFHMVNAEFYRIGKENVLKDLPLFCTMKASASYVTNSIITYLKLDKFYTILFNQESKNHHNALSDALNTAKIFFHLLNTGKITKVSIYKQENSFVKQQGQAHQKLSVFKRIIQHLFYGR